MICQLAFFWHYLYQSTAGSAIFTMDKNIEQRICLKFCVLNGISYAESLKMLQKGLWRVCFIKNTGSTSGIRLLQRAEKSWIILPPIWSSINVFNGGKRQQSQGNYAKNHYLNLREVARDLSEYHESIRKHFTLSIEHETRGCSDSFRESWISLKNSSKKMAEDMLEHVNSDPTFIQRIIAGEWRGYMSLTCKPVNRRLNGAIHVSQNPKNHLKAGQKVSRWSHATGIRSQWFYGKYRILFRSYATFQTECARRKCSNLNKNSTKYHQITTVFTGFSPLRPFPKT